MKYRAAKLNGYLILLSGIIIMYANKLNAQISPGSLTFAHEKLEGITNCTKCHVLGRQVQEDKCLACHTEIKQLVDENKGYHASSEVRNKKCWECHSEHHGRNFQIIHFDPGKFVHSKAGFILTGKHSQIKCVQCHQAKFIINKKLFDKRKGTYLGLSTDCISCHQDVHQGTLGNNCSTCHNTTDFKPAALFNHNNTKFKLTGAHKKVECVKCHPNEIREGKTFQKFTGIQFNNCTPCHKDVHNGQFGNDCLRCHNIYSFQTVNQKTFDHNKTKFPLKGAHENVACKDCHGKNILAPLEFIKCTDCHKDAHFGEFTKNNIVENCKHCHTVESFKITTFTIGEHDKTKFKLTGSHLAIACESCHYKIKQKQWHFKDIGINCIDCHSNVHGTEITKKYMPDNNCTACHSTDNWNQITFNHNLTSFKLEGMHDSTSCINCHEEKSGTGKITFRFVSLKSNCTNCHKDIHFGQFDSEKHGSLPVCENCHGFNNWKPVKFDHEKTSFPLKGAHEKVKCLLCHKTVSENGNVFVMYKLKEFKCASCHS